MVIRLFKVGERSFDNISDPIGELQAVLDKWDGVSDLNLAWSDDIKVEIIQDPAPSAYEKLIQLTKTDLSTPFRLRETFAVDGRKVAD